MIICPTHWFEVHWGCKFSYVHDNAHAWHTPFSSSHRHAALQKLGHMLSLKVGIQLTKFQWILCQATEKHLTNQDIEKQIVKIE